MVTGETLIIDFQRGSREAIIRGISRYGSRALVRTYLHSITRRPPPPPPRDRGEISGTWWNQDSVLHSSRCRRLEIKQIAVRIEIECLRIRIDLDGQGWIEVSDEAFGNEHVVEAKSVFNPHDTDVLCSTVDE